MWAEEVGQEDLAGAYWLVVEGLDFERVVCRLPVEEEFVALAEVDCWLGVGLLGEC